MIPYADMYFVFFCIWKYSYNHITYKSIEGYDYIEQSLYKNDNYDSAMQMTIKNDY
jgi:hypothetical protein